MAQNEVRSPNEPLVSDARDGAEKTTTSERRTPRTGGRPRHGKRVSDPDTTGSNDGNAKSRGPRPRPSPRRATPGRGRADDRNRETTTRSGARKPTPSKGEAARDEQDKPATRTSRETQASGAFVAKRAEPEAEKSGIFKRMSEALSRAVRGEDQDE